MHTISSLSIILTILLFAVTGCAGKVSPLEEANQAFADVETEMQSAIKDPARAKKAFELLTAIQRTYAEARVATQANNRQFRKLFANYDATQAELESTLLKIREDSRSYHKTWTSFHRQMVDVLTVEEWNKIQKTDSKAMSAAIKALEYRLPIGE